MNIKVIKRDGTKEDFDHDKITKVLLAASVEEKKAKFLSKNVTEWVNKLEKKEISSLEIRDQVLAQLKLVDTYAANMYDWYQHTKERASQNK